MTRDEIIKFLGVASGQMTVTFGVDDKRKIPVWDLKAIERVINEAVMLERDACARACETLCAPSSLSDPGRSWITGTMDCAEAIRARGEQ